jgi:hypothetical protein
MRGGEQKMKKGNGKLVLQFEVQEVREAEAEGQEGALAVLVMWLADQVAQRAVEERHKQHGVARVLEEALEA